MESPYDFVVKNIDPLPTLSIRGFTTPDELVPTVSEYLTQIWLYLQSKGLKPGGPSFTRYYGELDGRIDLEAGIPLLKPVPSDGHMRSGQLPGGEVVSVVHVGAYETLPGAEAALRQWMMRKRREASGPPWELYWVDSHMVSEPSQYRTEILMPLRPKHE